MPICRSQDYTRSTRRWALIVRSRVEVWPLEEADVTLARQLSEQYPTLGARDLCHLASCRRRSVGAVKTLDHALRAVVGETPRIV